MVEFATQVDSQSKPFLPPRSFVCNFAIRSQTLLILCSFLVAKWFCTNHRICQNLPLCCNFLWHLLLNWTTEIHNSTFLIGIGWHNEMEFVDFLSRNLPCHGKISYSNYKTCKEQKKDSQLLISIILWNRQSIICREQRRSRGFENDFVAAVLSWL